MDTWHENRQPGTRSRIAFSAAAAAPVASRYTADGHLQFPEDYREWVYLSTGFDMSYSPLTQPGHHMFDNVFVEPAAYRRFLTSGTWPNRTMFVLEVRGAEGKGSINQSGNFQSEQRMGLEVHVKDTARFNGGWAFYAFEHEEKTAAMLPQSAECYACHAKHGAVETTFVQFYPTLAPIAKVMGKFREAK